MRQLSNGWIVFLILLITVIWGYGWVYMKIGLDYMGPYTFSALRFAVGSLALIIFISFRKAGLPSKRHVSGLIIVGLFQTAFTFLLVMHAMQFVEAGKSSVLLYSMPIWSSVLAVRFLGERWNRQKVAGILLGSVGLCFIVGWDALITQNKNMLIGESLILLAAFSWAIANIYVKRHFAHADKLQMSTFQMTFGTIGIVLAALTVEWGEPVTINATSVIAVLFTGLLASAFCFTAWFYVLAVIDTTAATISTMLVPVFGLLFSWLALSEPMTVQTVIGTLLILAGVVTVHYKSQKSRSSKESAAPGGKCTARQ